METLLVKRYLFLNTEKSLYLFSMTKIKKQNIFTRSATHHDIKAIHALSEKVYGDWSYTESMIRGQIANFPGGQFIVEREGEIIGYAASFIISEKIGLAPHTWKEITGNGYAARHDDDGEYLYGMDVFVDPSHRRTSIGQRLYNARKKLVRDRKLKGIVFAGRMPGYKARQKKFKTPEDYLNAALNKTIRDPVITFQTRNDFEPLGILKNYLPSDKESLGNAVHMVWKNPAAIEKDKNTKNSGPRMHDSVRIACIQFQVRQIEKIEDFEQQIEYFVDVAADYRSDFVCFPELITLSLLSTVKKTLKPEEAIRFVTEYTDRYIEFMHNLATSYNINIIGGSHPTRVENGDVQNISYVFLRGGTVHAQPKIHPTPSEASWWNIKGGNKLAAINTDCGPIGVLVCYDSEFPELTRHLADQGALILFVPFCTDERKGYNRVRYCSQARAIENQMYVAMAGVVGNLPSVENMDIHYAESCILTPCDFPFARDGIAATSPANTETVVLADLRLDDLIINRNKGTVKNFKDRRFDLYRVEWLGEE